MKSVLAGAAAAFALSGCVIVASDDGLDYHSGWDSDSGSVFGATVLTDSVAFLVTSNGCTDKSYFNIDIDRHDEDEYSVTIDRRQQDRCRAYIPEGEEFVWTFEELGIPAGAEVSVGNEVRRR